MKKKSYNSQEKKKKKLRLSSRSGRHQRPASDLCLRQSVKAESVTPIPEHKRKNKENAVLLCISSHLPGIKSESDACPESSWYTRTHGLCAIAKRHFLVRGEAREEGMQGHGNSGTPEGRRARIGRDVESRGLKPKLKQTQESHRGAHGGHEAGLTSFTWVPGFCQSAAPFTGINF